MSSARFAKTDLARYPFLKENTEYVRKLDLKLEDLANPEFESVLERLLWTERHAKKKSKYFLSR